MILKRDKNVKDEIVINVIEKKYCYINCSNLMLFFKILRDR